MSRAPSSVARDGLVEGVSRSRYHIFIELRRIGLTSEASLRPSDSQRWLAE